MEHASITQCISCRWRLHPPVPMANTSPSLSGAFNILSAAGQGKLLYLKHKLKTLRLGCQGAGLAEKTF